MPANTSAKSEILTRIRAANRTTADTQIPRLYTRASTLTPEATLALFEDRLRDYDATVTRTTLPDLPAAIAAALTSRNKTNLVVPPGLPSTCLPTAHTFTLDDSLTPTQLDAFDGVLTASTLAIAETGTIVLQTVPGQGRRALSLVPDYHLCLVRASDIVHTVPEAFARLQPTAALATTFISGPSATADIEMTRIKGVHGPRILDVLLIL